MRPRHCGVLLWLIAPSLAQAPPVAALAIRGVTVIDGTDRPPIADRTVVIDGGRIQAIGAADLDVAESVPQLDGHGQFLIPGLWDMHVHMTAMPTFGELYVANGVTGVRDMFGLMAQIEPLRRAIAAGEQIGPRIVAAGRIVDGEKPIWNGSVEAITAADGERAVATVAREGSDFVKVYSKLSRDAYFAIAAEANQRKLPFAGHVPRAVSVAEAAAAGQRSIEHLTGVLEACSSTPERANDRNLPQAERLAVLVDTYDGDKARALAAELVRHDTFLCPTLCVLRALASLQVPEFTADPRRRYVPPFLEQMWDPSRDARFQSWTAADWAAMQRTYRQNTVVTTTMHAAGVRLLAGTDTGNPFCFPGFSLHDELQLLVGAGLTPLQALQAATRGPAQFLGLDAELGTIAVGKQADLVLLAADPLLDIANTTRIVAVIGGGRLFDRARLDAMLAAIARELK